MKKKMGRSLSSRDLFLERFIFLSLFLLRYTCHFSVVTLSERFHPGGTIEIMSRSQGTLAYKLLCLRCLVVPPPTNHDLSYPC